MAIQVDKIPQNINRKDIYLLEGETMETLCKLARRKWAFNPTDFFTQEDDNRYAVRIRTDRPAPSLPYTMRSTLYGSVDPYNPQPPLALTQANTDTWQRDAQPKNIDGLITDGVKIQNWCRTYNDPDGGVPGFYTIYTFSREEIKDLYGMTYYIGPEILQDIFLIKPGP